MCGMPLVDEAPASDGQDSEEEAEEEEGDVVDEGEYADDEQAQQQRQIELEVPALSLLTTYST